MTADGFEATFRLRIDRETAWQRLTETSAGSDDTRLWLPGFDSLATVLDASPPDRLRATKDDEPCAGTDIVITLEDEGTGTRVHVVQSRFGAWLEAGYEIMSVGWRYIVADLQTYLATGVHARRHLRPWGDLGAEPTAVDGGIRLDGVRQAGLVDHIGIIDGDLLTTIAGAPVASLDDLVTVLRVLPAGARPAAEWIRSGALMTTNADRPS
jgi:hypothetical protein